MSSLGIPSFQFYVGEASKELKCRSLTGPEKLKVFTQQGLEKHDVMTKIYFRASSHRGLQALRQIIEKRNRIEYFMDNGTKRSKKHDVSCSNCDESGHNRLTCNNPCKLCGEPYAPHLTILEHSGAKVPTHMRCRKLYVKQL